MIPGPRDLAPDLHARIVVGEALQRAAEQHQPLLDDRVGGREGGRGWSRGDLSTRQAVRGTVNASPHVASPTRFVACYLTVSVYLPVELEYPLISMKYVDPALASAATEKFAPALPSQSPASLFLLASNTMMHGFKVVD